MVNQKGHHMATLTDTQTGAPGAAVTATLTPAAGKTAYLESWSFTWTAPSVDCDPLMSIGGCHLPPVGHAAFVSPELDEDVGMAGSKQNTYTAPLVGNAPGTPITVGVPAAPGGGAVTVTANGHDA
jgi:hypothetical protein